MIDDSFDLQQLVSQFSDRALPPVASWNPSVQREIDMRIDHAGAWYYNGSEIKRQRMVALFSTILRRDGERYFLVTPQEKLAISVEDVPFKALLMDVSGAAEQQQLTFTDNVGSQFTAGTGHRLWIEEQGEQAAPYVMVRDRLPARLSRPVYYQLAELVCENNGLTGVWSGGVFFSLQGE